METIEIRMPKFPLERGEFFGQRLPRSSVSGFYRKRRELSVWQRRMQDRGWEIDVTGLYDAQTRQVARDFQREKHLKVDGLIGESTWYAAWTSSVT